MHRRSHYPHAETPSVDAFGSRGTRKGLNQQFLLPPSLYAEDDSMLNINPQKSPVNSSEKPVASPRDKLRSKEEEEFMLRHKRRIYSYNPTVLKQFRESLEYNPRYYIFRNSTDIDYTMEVLKVIDKGLFILYLAFMLQLIIYKEYDFADRTDLNEGIILYGLVANGIISTVIGWFKYRIAFESLKIRLIVSPETSFASSELFKRMVYESVVNLIFPAPFFKGIRYSIYNNNAGFYLQYEVNDIFVTISFIVKAYFILGQYYLANEFNSTKMQRLCSLYGNESFGMLFSFKCTLIRKPNQFLVESLVMSLIFFAFLIRVLERPLSDIKGFETSLKDWDDCIWFSIITMATVGYGDRVPKTSSARIICFFMIIWGSVWTSLFVSSLSSILELSIAELKSMNLLHRVNGRTEAQKSAASLIGKLMILNFELSKKVKAMPAEKLKHDPKIRALQYEIVVNSRKIKALRQDLDLYVLETLYFQDDMTHKFDKIKYIERSIIEKQKRIESMYHTIATKTKLLSIQQLRRHTYGLTTKRTETKRTEQTSRDSVHIMVRPLPTILECTKLETVKPKTRVNKISQLSSKSFRYSGRESSKTTSYKEFDEVSPIPPAHKIGGNPYSNSKSSSQAGLNEHLNSASVGYSPGIKPKPHYTDQDSPTDNPTALKKAPKIGRFDHPKPKNKTKHLIEFDSIENSDFVSKAYEAAKQVGVSDADESRSRSEDFDRSPQEHVDQNSGIRQKVFPKWVQDSVQNETAVTKLEKSDGAREQQDLTSKGNDHRQLPIKPATSPDFQQLMNINIKPKQIDSIRRVQKQSLDSLDREVMFRESDSGRHQTQSSQRRPLIYNSLSEAIADRDEKQTVFNPKFEVPINQFVYDLGLLSDNTQLQQDLTDRNSGSFSKVSGGQPRYERKVRDKNILNKQVSLKSAGKIAEENRKRLKQLHPKDASEFEHSYLHQMRSKLGG